MKRAFGSATALIHLNTSPSCLPLIVCLSWQMWSTPYHDPSSMRRFSLAFTEGALQLSCGFSCLLRGMGPLAPAERTARAFSRMCSRQPRYPPLFHKKPSPEAVVPAWVLWWQASECCGVLQLPPSSSAARAAALWTPLGPDG